MSLPGQVWRFAIANHDYWELLADPDVPPEISELDGEDREAFDAARDEVHDRIESLVRACWAELARRAKKKSLRARFSTKHRRGTILAQSSGVQLPRNRGWLELSIGEDDDGVLHVWATLYVAKKRVSALQAFFEHADGFDETSTWVGTILAPGLTDAEMADLFVDAFWNELDRWILASKGALDAAS